MFKIKISIKSAFPVHYILFSSTTYKNEQKTEKCPGEPRQLEFTDWFIVRAINFINVINFHIWTKAWHLAEITSMPYYFRILMATTWDFDASTIFCNIQNGCHKKNLLFHISRTVSHKTLTLGFTYTYPGIIISNMVYLDLSDIHIRHF